MTDMEAEIKDIKQHVLEISKKIDELIHEREVTSLMKLSEQSLSGLFEDEPDVYDLKDLKVRYK